MINPALTPFRVPLSDSGLPPGWGPWQRPEGWSFEPGAGPGGSPALKLARTDPAAYTLARLPFRLPPETRCRLAAAIRIDETTSGRIAALGGIEFFDAQNRYLGAGNLGGVCVAGEWVTQETEFTVPRFTDECRLQFYARPGAAGTIRFAAPEIGPASFRWTAYPLTPVRDELPAGGGPVTFGFFSQGRLEGRPPGGFRCRLEADGGRAQDVPVSDEGRFAADLGRLAPGPVSLRFTLLACDGSVIGTKAMALKAVDRGTAGARKASGCTMDAAGRLAVRGRPFFPLGLYMGYVQRDELKDIQGSPFNTLIPYGSCSMTLDGSAKTGVEGAREVLDACEAHGIKVIFSLAGAYDEPGAPVNEGLGVKTGAEVARTAVREFKDHPAVIAWYLNDEQPLECLPRLLERRRQLREMDPLHPVYAVMCQIPEFPFYSEITDVYGIDPYPIVDPAMNHIRLSQYAHEMAGRAVGTAAGVPLWTVVQAHNIGAYDQQAKKDPAFYRANYRDPSADEILALALLAVIRGARGLIFYSYFDLATPAFDAGSRERRWASAKRAAGAVKAVESMVMADGPSPELDLQVLEGAVEAKAFRDGAGKMCVLLAGIGPGPCRATFKAPADMKAMFGKIEPAGEGAYCFKGSDVAADVLW